MLNVQSKHYILYLFKTYAHVSVFHTPSEVFPIIDYLSGKEVPIIERNMSVQGAGLQADVYNRFICPWSMALVFFQIMSGFLSPRQKDIRLISPLAVFYCHSLVVPQSRCILLNEGEHEGFYRKCD